MFGCKNTDKGNSVYKRSFTNLIATSILSIVLCMACIVGGSWAWFVASHSTGVNTITAAHYAITEVKVTVAAEQGAAEDTEEQNSESGEQTVSVSIVNGVAKFDYEAGKTYTVTVKTDGSPMNAYLKIDPGTGNNGQYIVTKAPEEEGVSAGVDLNEVTFTVFNNGNTGTATIEAYWGKQISYDEGRGAQPQSIGNGYAIIDGIGYEPGEPSLIDEVPEFSDDEEPAQDNSSETEDEEIGNTEENGEPVSEEIDLTDGFAAEDEQEQPENSEEVPTGEVPLG